jgi:hypothetical protein
MFCKRPADILLLCTGALLILATTPPAPASPFGVTADAGRSDLRLDYEGCTDSYYRIQSSPSLTGTWSVVEFQLGRDEWMSWVDPGVVATDEFRIYRIGRVPLTNSLDYDGDRLGDAYELSHASLDVRDPDVDSDRLLDGDEVYAYGTSPSSPYSGADLYYTFATNAQGWSAETGAYGLASVVWSSTGHPDGGGLAITPAAGSGYGDYYIRDGSLLDHQNVLARPIGRAWFFLPADAPPDSVRVQFWIKSVADGWQTHYDDLLHALQPGQWTLVSWDMSAVSTQVLADVDEWAVKMTWEDRTTWSGTVLMDTVHTVADLPVPQLAPAITSVSPSSNTVAQYERFELAVALTNVYGLNPYDPDDVNLEASFTSPSGVVWKMCGFYLEDEEDAYSRGRWKVRFAPNEPGTWSCQVRVGNRLGTNTASASTFLCVAGVCHGWVRVSSRDPHYLEQQDGTPFYGIGYCRPYDADDEGLFADAQEHGVNLLHWWMAPWDTLLTVKAVEAGRESSSFYTYEQGRAREIDRIIGHAEKYGVKLVFTIWTHDALRDFNFHKFRSNGSWQKAFDQKVYEPERYINAFSELDEPAKSQKFFHDEKYIKHQEHLYRYIIARWGYSEAVGMWALASEMFGTTADSRNCVRYQDPMWVTNKGGLVGLDPYENMDTNQCDGADYTIPWITFINDYFKAHDPFGHPTTASGATDEYWDDGFGVVDIPQIHSYADTFSWITPPITFAKYHHYLGANYNKPSFMGETGSWKWRIYQPDFLRACMWPALCSGAAVTPMMWTVPAFGQYCDPIMGPWSQDMADEAQLFSEFIRGIDFPLLHLAPAAVSASDPGDAAPAVIENFEGALSPNWHLFGTGAVAMAVSASHTSEGSHSLRLDLDMDTWANMTNPASGIYNFTLNYNWSSYWPDGTLRLDVFIPELYHPTNNPDGFLTGINRDLRSIVEIAVEGEDGQWRWYSTRTEYSAEHEGWKKLTLGMWYNLEFRLEEIPTAYQAARIRGIKIWFGDAGILRGPVYIDNIAVGRYPYNTWGMVSSNRQFGIAWIQDRQWTNTLNRNAVFQMQGVQPGRYNVEWWNSRRDGINSAGNLDAPTGTLAVADVPDFQKDVALKIRRIGDIGTTIHDVSVGAVSQLEWVVRSQSRRVNVVIVNQGTANENCDVSLTDVTDGRGVGTNHVTANAGQTRSTSFTWSDTNASVGTHSLRVFIAPVGGETDTGDNELTTKVKVLAAAPPWDPCDRLRRWAPITSLSDARALRVSTNRFTEGRESFLLDYGSPLNYYVSMGFDNVLENWSNRTSIAFDLYNEGSANSVQFQMRTGNNWAWYYSSWSGLNSGWNTNLTFYFGSNTWEREEGTNHSWNVRAGGLEAMQLIYIKIVGHTNAGAAYIDNIRLR